MASGYGVKFPLGRCYPMFLEFSECIATNPDRNACSEMREDYMECLHHKKETQRLNKMAGERARKIAAHQDVPETLIEQIGKGAVKVPFTNVK
mmetsp:Transcript_47528/g.107137  ORF Transcript_47528/g.107137 Transcript_47528/m.107137 type:complete len:93 (-) Transcript_47528:355-633(-)